MEEKETILIVDEDKESAKELAQYLEKHGYTAAIVGSGKEMFSFLQEQRCIFLFLECSLKEEDGLEVCKKLRQISSIPLIFLSEIAEPADRTIGLEMGADDYLAKPYDKRELLARMKAILRRTQGKLKAEGYLPLFYRFDNWLLDCTLRHLLDENKEIIHLSGAEYKLLLFFLSKPQQVFSREELMEALQGSADIYDRSPFDRSIDIQISRLRKRLREKDRPTQCIKTVRGDGYVFTADVDIIK